jgi:hypothetical protein
MTQFDDKSGVLVAQGEKEPHGTWTSPLALCSPSSSTVVVERYTRELYLFME